MSAPAFATWLLQKFRPSDEALLGDLLEECPNGRSSGWYPFFLSCVRHPSLRVHSGFILVPLVMVLTGLLSCRPAAREQIGVKHTS
jgi:hypothetical protein